MGVKGDASEPGGGPFQEAGVPGSSSVVVAANGVFRRLQPGNVNVFFMLFVHHIELIDVILGKQRNVQVYIGWAVMYVSVDISFWSDKVLRFQKKQELTLI